MGHRENGSCYSECTDLTLIIDNQIERNMEDKMETADKANSDY